MQSSARAVQNGGNPASPGVTKIVSERSRGLKKAITGASGDFSKYHNT